MPRTNPKYRQMQTTHFRQPDEKIAAKISKLYDGECLGYYKTTWAVYVAIVKIGDRFEFCWLDEGYVVEGPKSWGVQKVDYFVKIGKGWDLYFEHVWCWTGAEAPNEYFDWVSDQEDAFYAEEPVKEEPKPIEKPQVRAIKTKMKSPKQTDDDGQMFLFEGII